MAKVTGQSVPSEDKHAVEACIELARADGTVRKRFPKRINDHPLPKKLAQQDRFKKARTLFASVDNTQRQRWYDNRPVWNSFLWYYNYFMMSALAGNADPQDGGLGVIKSIQVIKEEVPTTGTKSFTISTVDPTKCVVMIQGNSYISDTVQRGADTITDGGTKNHVLSPEVDPTISEVRITGQGGRSAVSEGDGVGDWAAPYVSALIAAQLTVQMIATQNTINAGYGWEVIERKAQTIYPVLVSIAAEAVVIDWAKIPSVAADVSITVIEYI